MSGRQASIEKVAKEIASGIKDGSLLGLGSGSTVAALLPTIARIVRERGVRTTWVPTSLQIQFVADELGLNMSPLRRPHLAHVVDGADQIDRHLNLIKGGGGALLKEKVLLSCTKDAIVVADEKKFVERLCMNDVRVPVEVNPFASQAAKEKLEALGGDVRLRLDQRGYPSFSESGNLIMDVLFRPLTSPRELETKLKIIPGVMEAGIFTITPIKVYKITQDGSYELLQKPRR